MGLEDIKTWVEIVQSVVTTIGLLAAGIWSYYTFVRSRAFAPNVKIEFALKSVVELDQAQGVIIAVKVRNIGKTKVDRSVCLVTVQAVVEPRVIAGRVEFIRIDQLDDQASDATKRDYSILDNHGYLEPGEHVEEDMLFLLGKSPVFKVSAWFRDTRGHLWYSNAILDARQAKPKTETLRTITGDDAYA